jgi:hypothetical protein
VRRVPLREHREHEAVFQSAKSHYSEIKDTIHKLTPHTEERAQAYSADEAPAFPRLRTCSRRFSRLQETDAPDSSFPGDISGFSVKPSWHSVCFSLLEPFPHRGTARFGEDSILRIRSFILLSLVFVLGCAPARNLVVRKVSSSSDVAALQQRAEQGVAQTQVVSGVAALQQRAEHDDAEAQYNLGVMYMNGKGVPQDDTLAVQ